MTLDAALGRFFINFFPLASRSHHQMIVLIWYINCIIIVMHLAIYTVSIWPENCTQNCPPEAIWYDIKLFHISMFAFTKAWNIDFNMLRAADTHISIISHTYTHARYFLQKNKFISIYLSEIDQIESGSKMGIMNKCVDWIRPLNFQIYSRMSYNFISIYPQCKQQWILSSQFDALSSSKR